MKFQQYQKQAKLLRYYNIETEKDHTFLTGALESSIESLESARKPLYNEKRKIQTPQEKDVVQHEITRLTEELKTLRTQRTICNKILESKPHVLEQVKFANRIVEEEKELQEQTEKKEKNIHHKR